MHARSEGRTGSAGAMAGGTEASGTAAGMSGTSGSGATARLDETANAGYGSVAAAVEAGVQQVEAARMRLAALTSARDEVEARLADRWEESRPQPAGRVDDEEPHRALLEHPLAAIGLAFAAGMLLAVDSDARSRARLKQRLRRATAIAATAGAALVMERLLGSPAAHLIDTGFEPGSEPESEPLQPALEADAGAEDESSWLVSATDARAFPDLPVSEAEERIAALWERVAAEPLPPGRLCLAGDRVARLAHSHPRVPAPDVVRVLAVWPVLAGADATVGAQVAWTAGRAGLGHVIGALDLAVRESGVSRAVAEDFVKQVLALTVAAEPPLSHGVPSPPSTVYAWWPRDGRRREGAQPPQQPDRKEPPGPVHLGAAAPQSVRPGNRFLAYFAAYTDAYAAWVQEKLLQEMLPEELRLDKKQAGWKDGTRIVVVPVSEALEFDPPQAEFTWNGRFEIQEFACTVRDGAQLGSTVLEFQVNARVPDGGSVQFEKVRVGLGIVENAPVRTPRLVARLMATTAFISYASADRELVSYKLSPLRPLGIQVYDWRLDATEGQGIKETIEPEIRGRELFFLFWSRNAQASEWVAWELEVALDSERSGRPRIIPQLLENLDQEKDLPPQLLGRQFVNPFFLFDRPERIRELVDRIGEPSLSRAPREAAFADARDALASRDGAGVMGLLVPAAGDDAKPLGSDGGGGPL